MLVVSYESTKQHTDDGEFWEFFRHCRNAAAHGGRFNFLGAEPKRPARWQGPEITRALHGKPLFRQRDNSFLGIASLRHTVHERTARSGRSIRVVVGHRTNDPIALAACSLKPREDADMHHVDQSAA